MMPSVLIGAEQLLQILMLIMLTAYFLLFVTGLIYGLMNAHQTRQILLERNRFMSEASRDKLTGLANTNHMYPPER
ncbi:MAG: hypothetical protein JXN62_11030 [Bacteroidales bacterium]|nr:hypothetical protein [Bacteroidales bacterium]